MAELFNRESKVTVGTVGTGGITVHSQRAVRDGKRVNQGLDVAFSVATTLDRDPNTAELRIFNLKASNRGLLQELPEGSQVIIEAGYEGSLGQVFRGGLQIARSTREGPDWVTVIEAADGDKEVRSARINESFPAGTDVNTVLEKLGSKLGAGLGNAAKKLFSQASFVADGGNQGKSFINGTALTGSVADRFTELLDSVGFEWSVQNQQIQILQKDQPLDKEAVLLNRSTGLVGSPEVGSDGVAKFRSLMQAEIYPGRQVKIESQAIASGAFRCLTASYVGETNGPPWYVEGEGKRL